MFRLLFDHAKSYFVVYKSGTCAAEHTASLLSLQCFSLLPPFLFSLFFCSLAAARRQEQHGQTGFLSLAVIHLSKCRSFPSTVLFYSKFLSLICHQNVVSHASNLVTHLAVLSLLNIDILFFSNVSKHCSSAWSGGHSCVSFQRN